MKRNKRTRIKDIAKMADVSVGTVDRVIHNRGNVSLKTEKKIKTILNKTGYTPDPIAQSLGAKKDNRIAVMIPCPEQDEYWQLSNRGIGQARCKWESHNIYIDLNTFDLDNPKSFTQAADQVIKSKPDAVLTVPVFDDESLVFFQNLQAANIPYVLFNTEINAQFKQYGPLCFIGQDLHQSGRLAAELMHMTLQEPGKVAVMHIHEVIDNSIHLKEKEQGFRDYFNELNTSGFEISTFSFFDNDKTFESQIGNCIANTDLKGIFVPTSSGTFKTAKAMENHNKKEIFLIGYDLLEQNIHFLNAGIINFLINQDPRHQAFQGIHYLVNHLLLNLAIPPADLLPLEIVSQQNYTSFLKKPI